MRHPCTLVYKNGIHDCSGPILKLGYLRLNYFLKKSIFVRANSTILAILAMGRS